MIMRGQEDLVMVRVLTHRERLRKRWIPETAVTGGRILRQPREGRAFVKGSAGGGFCCCSLGSRGSQEYKRCFYVEEFIRFGMW